MKNIIEIKKLNMKFKDNHVLKDVSLSIPKGQNISLAGSNGCGKTTFIETILGINTKTSGEVKINVPNDKIGIQFQDSILPEGLTSIDIINFFNSLNNNNMNVKDLNKIIKTFEMESFLYNEAHSLSGGERQKLNILLSTIHKPNLIILDEVSTGLDITTRNTILKYIVDNFKDTKSTIISISHDEDEMRTLTNRFVFMHLGKIIYDKPIKEVLKEFGTIKNAFNWIPKEYYETKNKNWYVETK